ncbi:hypothetical protein C8F04DRAFT_1367589 [Mycena alexandri]|uniref:DUF6534 domain-containing protein n=1 Tax=Mycena alexandri TaxID=1745969 RepID=A0AAD6SNZ8_9AGAR|nr:hypothetical protein C8F04DRAFT_1367589 [Mycena alexandri]
MPSPLDSTYGAWFVSLFIETILYGMGALQAWIYFTGRPTDAISVKSTVLLVLALETIQVTFFFRSSYFRFVERFGILQTDLIWADSLQLLAAYLSAFAVQIYFASRIDKLTKARGKFGLSAIGLYTIFLLAFVQIVAGITQTIRTQKGEIKKTNYMVDMLIYDAINRGSLTAVSSCLTMVLFLALPDTFWFFLGLAPSSKLYMNSMLAT